MRESIGNSVNSTNVLIIEVVVHKFLQNFLRCGTSLASNKH